MTEQIPQSTEQQNAPPPIEVHGRFLSLRKMAAVSLIGSGLLTGLANYFNGHNDRPKIPAIDVNWGNDAQQSGSDISGGFDVAAKDGDTLHVADGRSEAESTKETTRTETLKDIMGEQWARRFAGDEHAGELVNPAEIDTFADKLLKVVSEGWQIDSLSIRGNTSAEDDSVDANGNRTAGLQQTSPEAAEKQDELGNKRRDVGTLLLVDALAERGISVDSDSIESLPSVEDVLSDEEVAVIDGLAKQFGYASHTTMIEQWNRDPDSVQPEVDKALIDMLAKERTLSVKVSLSKTDSTPNIEMGSNGAEIGPITDGGKELGDEEVATHDNESHQIRILPIIIPGFFFVTRRRKGDQQDNVAQLGPTTLPETPVSGKDSGSSRVTPAPRYIPPPFEPGPVRLGSKKGFNPHSNGHKEAPVSEPGVRRKQPRTHNFSGNRGRERPGLAGGRGRRGRGRGGDRP